ncbi:MAG TPA: hypothetical protein VMW86_09635 [Dehalococcoidales bacterium]|nr:hypothetical protein [Dehalococcoidales bacterium]
MKFIDIVCYLAFYPFVKQSLVIFCMGMYIILKRSRQVRYQGATYLSGIREKKKISSFELNQVARAEIKSSRKWLYRVGGVAALVIPLMYIITGVIVVRGYSAGPFPTSVAEWFAVFQDDWLTGLFYLGFADIIITVASGLMSLALYFALRRVNWTCMIIAIPFVFVGIAVYLTSNTAFTMLSLSSQYAASSVAQRAMFLAAGQATIAITEGTGGLLGMALVWVASLMMSAVMLRSKIFSKVTAWVGIPAFLLLLASIPFGGYTNMTPRGPVLTAIIYVLNYGGGLLSMVWYILVGLRLLKLGRLEGNIRLESTV